MLCGIYIHFYGYLVNIQHIENIIHGIDVYIIYNIIILLYIQ